VNQKQLAKMVADVCRTAAFSELCYQRLLAQATFWHQATDIFVAVATAGAVGSWAIWQQGSGKIVWQVLGAIVTIVNIAKPYLKLGDKINVSSRQASAYRELFVDAKAVCDALHLEGKIDADYTTRIRQLRARLDPLERADLVISEQTKTACQGIIAKQFPKTYFWRPPDGGSCGSEEEDREQADQEEGRRAQEGRARQEGSEEEHAGQEEGRRAQESRAREEGGEEHADQEGRRAQESGARQEGSEEAREARRPAEARQRRAGEHG
jgi:hypothetical protein